MSTTPLSNSQEIIERSIFERIRLEIVDKGYYPNIAATSGLPAVPVYPNTPAGKVLLDNDVASIVTSKGFAIELFNNVNSKALGTKKIPRIVINSDSFLEGALGGDSTKIFRTVGQGFSAYQQPPQTSNFYFNIRLVSNNVSQERILTSLLSLALPKRAYIPLYNAPTYNFFCRNLNSMDISNETEGYIEKYLAYEVQDVWDMEDALIAENITAISQITLHPNVQSYRDGTFGYGSDDLVID